jgi:hypothetical protein
LAQPKRYTNLINLMTNLDLKTKIWICLNL